MKDLDGDDDVIASSALPARPLCLGWSPLYRKAVVPRPAAQSRGFTLHDDCMLGTGDVLGSLFYFGELFNFDMLRYRLVAVCILWLEVTAWFYRMNVHCVIAGWHMLQMAGYQVAFPCGLGGRDQALGCCMRMSGRVGGELVVP